MQRKQERSAGLRCGGGYRPFVAPSYAIPQKKHAKQVQQYLENTSKRKLPSLLPALALLDHTVLLFFIWAVASGLPLPIFFLPILFFATEYPWTSVSHGGGFRGNPPMSDGSPREFGFSWGVG